jgi:hypothetical protein
MGDIDVYKETIEHDRLSFPVVESIAKSYGYKSGDLIYYLLSGSTLRNGLKLITSNFDVYEIVQAHSGLPIIELYINSFSESIQYIYCFILFSFIVKMARWEFVFEVHYGGHFDRRFTNTYVGGDIDVYKETIEHDRLSFPVVESIAKSYGYKSGDLIYYLLSGNTLRNGLKLITSNFDEHKIVQAHSGLPIIELYINSFSESIPDIGEENCDDDNGDEEGGYSRIERDDP